MIYIDYNQIFVLVSQKQITYNYDALMIYTLIAI